MIRDDDEEGEDTDYMLVARKRESIEALKAAEPVTVERVQPGKGPSRIPESSGVDDASCRDEQPTGMLEGFSSKALQKEENAPSDSLGATTLHREASSKYRTELARCEADLKKLTKERNALKLLYVHKEEEIMSIRAELTRAHQDQTELIEQIMSIFGSLLCINLILVTNTLILQVQQKAELVEQLREEAKMREVETLGWKQSMDRLASEKDAVRAQLSSVERQLQSVKVENLDRAQKVKELETRLAAELARATSEAEVLVASYRADAKAANTWAKENSDAAEVRLSRVADHARHQSRR
ncbi:uncharacterized protein [Nicotiana tomentosiformis]|uniref:uncharacterized protein n=1 Tax=Nicotiana tomentosiformis TaxID=4098 RepID=UPI00388C6DF7